MTIIVSRAGIEGTDIKPDSPEWSEWFISQPEGTKIQFTWIDDYFREQRFTAYRRKRYWEAQKRVSGRLRNTTIKPEGVTYELLRQMGLKLTAYNWAEKFEYKESGNQTHKDTSSLTKDEIENLQARIVELEAENERLESKLGALEREMAESRIRLPDLLEIRDHILKEWKLSGGKEKKARLWEFSERLIRAIEDVLPEPDYTHFQRMRSELEQLRKNEAASVRGAIQWEERYREARRRLEQRGF